MGAAEEARPESAFEDGNRGGGELGFGGRDRGQHCHGRCASALRVNDSLAVRFGCRITFRLEAELL
jgi:hypothetical protein